MVVLRSFAAAALFALLHGSAQATNTCKTLHFEGPARGEFVSNQFKDNKGVMITCFGGNGKGCRIFDTSTPWGDWSSSTPNECTPCTLANCDGLIHVDDKDITLKSHCGDPDLGSPNESCPGGGIGIGAGGQVGSPYENCEALGNVLVQDEYGADYPPSDSKKPGTMIFSFDNQMWPNGVDLSSITILDTQEQKDIKITVRVFTNRCAARPPAQSLVPHSLPVL